MKNWSQLRRRTRTRAAAKARGTMGIPLSRASSTTPDLTCRRGPLGPSGVITTFRSARSPAISSRKARAPPRVAEPRTTRNPRRAAIRAMYSPSRCWLMRMLHSRPE